ncbi:unnamed protein product [Calypogeia fissa]
MVRPKPPLTWSRSRALAAAAPTVACAAAAAQAPPIPPHLDALSNKANRLQDLLYYNWIVPDETYAKLTGRPGSSPHRVSVFKMGGDQMTDTVLLTGCIHPFEEVCDDGRYERILFHRSRRLENDSKKRAHLVKWLWHHHSYLLGTRDSPEDLDFHLYR